MVYSYGLSASRYIEYSRACQLLKSENIANILDIGSGHSLLPSLLASEGYKVSIVDVSSDSITWQKAKMGNRPNTFHAMVASALELPFEDGSFAAVTCVSVLEHIRDEGDIKAVGEISRVLKDNGVCIISTGVSPEEKFADWLRGIPPWAHALLGERRLEKLLRAFNTDRNKSYFERFYAVGDVVKRFENLSLSVEYQQVYWDWGGTKILHKVIPMGSVSLIEYALARIFNSQSGSRGNIGTMILKLRKV